MIKNMKACEEETFQVILFISLSHIHKQNYTKPFSLPISKMEELSNLQTDKGPALWSFIELKHNELWPCIFLHLKILNTIGRNPIFSNYM